MSLTKQFLNIGNLVPLALADLNANDSTQRATPGFVGFYQDNFGPRWFKYIFNASGTAYTIGQVVGRTAVITKTTNTAPSTTAITVTTTGITASQIIGQLLVDELASAAGTAPEGETGVITAASVSGATVTLTINSQLAWSAKPAVGDLMRIKTPGWHTRLAQASAKTRDVVGVVVGAQGIASNNYGWVQIQGICPLVAMQTGAPIGMIDDQAVIMDTTAGVVVSSTSPSGILVLGRCMCTNTTTNSGFVPVELTLGLVGGVVIN